MLLCELGGRDKTFWPVVLRHRLWWGWWVCGGEFLVWCVDARACGCEHTSVGNHCRSSSLLSFPPSLRFLSHPLTERLESGQCQLAGQLLAVSQSVCQPSLGRVPRPFTDWSREKLGRSAADVPDIRYMYPGTSAAVRPDLTLMHVCIC